MLVLALDTTNRQGSCALAENSEVRLEWGGDPDQPQATRLPGDLRRLLAQCGHTLTDIDLFAVATGPGSFTGLRVGIATMQGLAFALNKPLIGVSAFDALAAMAEPLTSHEGTTARTVVWIDAWRGEVYSALYEGRRPLEPPTVERPEGILQRLPGHLVFIGDAIDAQRPLIQSVCGDAARLAQPPAPLLAGTMARMAYELARTGVQPSPDAITPLYVRRPDAEIARDARPTH